MDNTDPQTSGVIPGTEGLSGAGGADTSAQTAAPAVQSTPMPAGATQVAAPSPQTQSSPAPSSSAPMAAPGTPHAGLRNMLQSLFEGMDAFATAAATGGKEGGAEEVQRFRAQQQDMALKRQAGQREQSQADAMIQHTQALTNSTIAQTEINKMNAPLDYQNKVLENQKALYDLYVNVLHVPAQFAVPMVAGQGTDVHTSAISNKANGDLVNNTVIPVHDEKVGGSGTTYGFSYDQLRKVNVPIEQAAPVLTTLQNQINLAKSVLPQGEKDPEVQAAQGKLDVLKKGSSINGFDFFVFNNTVQNGLLARVNNQKDISTFQKQQAEAKSAQQAADPLFKMENEPGEMSGEKSSAAIPLLQSKLTDPATPPADKIRASRLLAVAQSAHARYLQDVTSKANAEQAAKQGDPVAAGEMLAKGQVTQEDLRVRGVTEKFMQQALSSAIKFDPKYNPDDESNAKKIAASPQGATFFGSANSLLAKGGTLDQVVDAGAKLPNYKIPIFNKWADAKSYQSGNPEVAAYMQSALAAADDYAKVIGGGTPTEGMQLHMLNSLTASLNQPTRIAVVGNMKKGVVSQIESRIGTNKFLMRTQGYNLPGNQPAAAAFDPKTDFKPIQPTQ